MKVCIIKDGELRSNIQYGLKLLNCYFNMNDWGKFVIVFGEKKRKFMEVGNKC